jgi:hypothetical protein
MVNAGFPPRRTYGFEKVDASVSGGGRRQSKIHTESNLPDFLRISAELSSLQTLTTY